MIHMKHIPSNSYSLLYELAFFAKAVRIMKHPLNILEVVRERIDMMTASNDRIEFLCYISL